MTRAVVHRRSVGLLAVALVCALTACAKRDEAPAGPRGPEPMSLAEQQRGLQACRAYAERVCRCAKTDPSLAKECSLAPSRPAALEGTLEIVNKGHGKAAINDQVATQSGARKIINECFSADAKLDPATCPREAPAGSAEPAPAGPAAAGNPPQTTP